MPRGAILDGRNDGPIGDGGARDDPGGGLDREEQERQAESFHRSGSHRSEESHG